MQMKLHHLWHEYFMPPQLPGFRLVELGAPCCTPAPPAQRHGHAGGTMGWEQVSAWGAALVQQAFSSQGQERRIELRPQACRAEVALHSQQSWAWGTRAKGGLVPHLPPHAVPSSFAGPKYLGGMGCAQGSVCAGLCAQGVSSFVCAGLRA